MAADGNREIRGIAAVPRQTPFAIEAEQNVLGALLQDNKLFHEINGKLTALDFYRADHQVIYLAIGEMIRDGKACDFVTLTEHCRSRSTLDEVGGMSYLGKLFSETHSRANVVQHADLVRERSLLRRLIATGGDIAEMGYRQDGQDVDALVGRALDLVTSIMRDQAATSLRFSEAVDKARATADRIRKARAEGRRPGMLFGVEKLDKLTGGLWGPKLVVIAARPKCGKSALLNQGGIFAAAHGQPGYIDTIELNDEDLAYRGLATIGQQNVTSLSRGNQQAHDAASDALVRMGDIPLFIDDRTRTLEGFCAQVAYHKHRHGITWAAVDHIGLMRTKTHHRSRNDQMGEISWGLKQLAKSLGIPIFALSQLSRDCDKENRRPRPDDLRDSGNIEQDADMVIMLHTPQAKRDLPERPLWIGVPLNRSGPAFWLKGEDDTTAPFVFMGPTQTIVENTRGIQ